MRKTIQLIALTGFIFFSTGCGKDEEDSPSTPTNVDFTGVYTGEVSYSNARMNTGDPLVVTINGKNGDKYNMEVNDETIATIIAAGNSFTGSAVSSQTFSELKGSLTGDALAFTLIDKDTLYSFKGNRPASGGGNTSGGCYDQGTVVGFEESAKIEIDDFAEYTSGLFKGSQGEFKFGADFITKTGTYTLNSAVFNSAKGTEYYSAGEGTITFTSLSAGSISGTIVAPVSNSNGPTTTVELTFTLGKCQ